MIGMFVLLVFAFTSLLWLAGYPWIGISLGVLFMILAAAPTGKLGGSGLFDIELRPGQKPWL